jgi:Cu(I)/Ag(I) efflux system membrane fusion protein
MKLIPQKVTAALAGAASLVFVLLGAGQSTVAAEDGEREVLYWVAPMDPNYRREKPGKSPMGMDLIPVYADGEDDSGSDVTIAPEVVQNLGVRTIEVEHGALSRQIDTVGYVDYDEAKVSHIHLRVSGWIERLTVRSEGERVKKGTRLFSLYSPELVNAQEEFVQALSVSNKRLIQASRDRLVALGITSGQIKALETKRRVRQTISILAPQDGVVSNLPVREGMYVKPAMRIMTLADLSSVWLLAEVFERQSEWVSTGNDAEVHLPYLPGRVWQGKVEYIYPSLDPKTRTLKVRLRFDNPEETLKPNMYASVRLFATPKENALTIPLEALIRTGGTERVIIAKGEGRFDAREITTGVESGERIEVLEGLEAGEEVVVSGQFLIDSEASLKASFTRMSESESVPTAKEGAGEPDAAQPLTGTGVVTGLMPGEDKINLQHDPIPALGWPQMQMDFPLAEGVSLEGIALDDKVEFEMEKQGNLYPITVLRRVAP